MSRNAVILLSISLFVALAAGSVQALALPANSILLAEVADNLPELPTDTAGGPVLAPSVALPRMSPELALATFLEHSGRQSQTLAGYSASTVVRAELPASAQQGEIELERHFVAPRTLTFKALHYIGDGFVKTNVIVRLLQSEVDHLQKDDPDSTALGPANYKFSHKGTVPIDGHEVHVYQVKPRKKRAGLFKGHIYVDVYTGSLVRAEGRIVKSPSVFVNKIDFVQDYADVQGFTLPVHMHSEAKAALVGRTVVDIVNHDYQPMVEPSAASGAN